MLKTVTTQNSSLALVYPASSFLAKPLCRSLLHHGCRVVALSEEFAENLLPLFDHEGFTFSYLEDFEKKPPEKIDYFFEIGSQNSPLGFNEYFLPLVKKQQIKYEIILKKENNRLVKILKKQKINFRAIVGHQIFGPGMDLSGYDFVTRTINSGIKKKPLLIPGNGLVRIYPLFIDDFASSAVRAMFSPGTADQTFHIFGKSITAFSFVHLVKQASGEESKIKTVTLNKIGEIEQPSTKNSHELKTILDWQPQKDLEKPIKKTIWAIREKQTKTEEIKVIKKVTENRNTNPTPLTSLEKKQKKIKLTLEQASPKTNIMTRETPVTSKTNRSFSTIQQPPLSPPIIQKQKPSKKKRTSKKARRLLKIFFLNFLIFIITLTIPMIFIGYNAYLGASHLKKSKIALTNRQLASFGEEMEKAQIRFNASQQYLVKIEPALETLKLESVSLVLNSWFTVGNQMAKIGVLGTQIAQSTTNFGKKVLNSEPVNVDQFVNQENQLLNELILEISLLQTQIDKDDLLKVNLPGVDFQQQFQEIKKLLPQIKDLAASAKETLPLLSSLMAKNSRRTYLILFQNNMELRPTGGFIGSFGLVTFEKSRFLDFGVLDVYAADGQLKGHVEPPEKLKEYLGEAGWYLRDSNWDPDFPSSARKAAWFLEKEMGRTTDGVIAINLNFAQKLLATLGEIYLPDYNEKINAVNLFERAEYHSEIGTFPGSTQKSDFLGNLANAVFEKIKSGRDQELFAVAQALHQSLEQQDLFIYLDDPKAMEIIQKSGWSGEIISAVDNQQPISRSVTPLRETTIFSDYLMLVEANVGVNKANFFINRKIDQKIEINQNGNIIHRLKITYQNTAKTSSWPAGKYKNYLRVYVPLGSTLRECQMSNVKCQMEEFTEHGKTVFATLIEVPVSEEKAIELTWQIPQSLPQQERVSYLFLQQKQSGMIETNNSVLFSFPAELKPLVISPAGAYSPGTLLFANSLEKSHLYRIEFVR